MGVGDLKNKDKVGDEADERGGAGHSRLFRHHATVYSFSNGDSLKGFSRRSNR